MKPAILAFSLVLLAVPSAFGAQPPSPPQVPQPPRPPEGPGSGQPSPGLDALLSPGAGIPLPVARALGLSDELVKKIRDAAFDANDELIGLEATLKRAQLNLERALAETAPQEKAVLGRLDEVGKAELAVRRNRMRLLLKVRGLLGPELWQRLQAHQPDPEAVSSEDGRVMRMAVGAELALAIPDLARVAVSKPEVADVRVERDRVLVFGIAEGRTTVVTWSKDGTQRAHLIIVEAPGPRP